MYFDFLIGGMIFSDLLIPGNTEQKMIGRGKWSLQSIQPCENDAEMPWALRVRRFRVNRTHDAIDADFDVKEDIDDSFALRMDVYKMVDGGYKSYMTIEDDCLPNFVRKYANENVPMAFKAANIDPPDFPIPKGQIQLKSFVMDMDDFSKEGIYGEFRVDTFVMKEGNDLACMRLRVKYEPKEELYVANYDTYCTLSANSGYFSTCWQHVPEALPAIKALVTGSGSVLVTWRAPAKPNGDVTHYNVYAQAQGVEPHSYKVPATRTSYSVSDLKASRYDFWVTASTTAGESQPSETASCSPTDQVSVPAKIASFDASFNATYKEDVKLACLAVGVPPPNIVWKIDGKPLEASKRVRLLPDGSLRIVEVSREDAGAYSCHVANQFGTDSVTHTISVLAPPFPPQLGIASSSASSLTLRLKPSDDAHQPLAAGYTIHYREDFGDWETVQIPSNNDNYTLENLSCGSRYQLYVTAYNGIGSGEATDTVIVRTLGSKPAAPRAADFIKVGSSSVALHLKEWLDGGCPMSHFVIENKMSGAAEWELISNSANPGVHDVIRELEPATRYVLRVTAHNSAGFTVAEYEYSTET